MIETKSRDLNWTNLFEKARKTGNDHPLVAILFILVTAILLPILINVLSSILGNDVRVVELLSIVIVILFVVIAVLIIKSPEGQLPDEILLGDYRIRSISTPDLIKQANKITHQVFGDATVEDDPVEKILKKNKYATIGLLEKRDDIERLVGYASCWPITKEAYERLRLGEDDPEGMPESALTASDVLSDWEIDKTEVLYIPSIAVLNRRSYEGRKRAAVLICSFLQHIKTVYRPVADRGRTIKLFIVGFTEEGQKLTRRMAGHLGLNAPSGYLTLYAKKVPFYETNIFPADWDHTVAKVEGAVFRALFLPDSAA